jgi:hypothetical protein
MDIIHTHTHNTYTQVFHTTYLHHRSICVRDRDGKTEGMIHPPHTCIIQSNS